MPNAGAVWSSLFLSVKERRLILKTEKKIKKRERKKIKEKRKTKKYKKTPNTF